MGFSGGGSNVLKSHTHDGTIVQDGGSLNMDNVTQAALTAGDIVYSDGNHLQRLAIGGSGQSLTSSGSAPQWSAASSSLWSLIESQTLTTPSNDLTITPSPAITFDSTVNEIYCPFRGSMQASQDLRFTVNNSTASVYNLRYGYADSGGGSGGVSRDNEPEWALAASDAESFFNGWIKFYIVSNNSGDNVVCGNYMLASNNAHYGSINFGTVPTNSITEIKMWLSGSANLSTGSTLGVFKLSNA